MVHIAVIGGGYWGKNLIREFNNCGILHTICEINEDALTIYQQQYPKIHLTKDWSTILENQEIDSVCIALPAEMHYRFAKEALCANKHVYVEKPLCLDEKEGEELVKLSLEKGKILMVGHLLHYHPAVIKMKELIKEGKIGKVKNIVSNRLSHGIFRTSENVLWSFAPHDISVILSIIGESPNSVICSGTDIITKGIMDITNSILKFEDVYVNINVNWLCPYKEQKMSIIGEKGMILFDDTNPTEKLKYFSEYLDFKGKFPIPVKDKFEVIQLDNQKTPLRTECEHFKQSVENNRAPITNGEEGLRVLRVLKALQESLDKNAEVKLMPLASSIVPSLPYFAHESAYIDEGAEIGEGTKIWHFSHICKGAKIGKNCNIGQNVFIAGGAVLGDNCKVQNNVSIYAGVIAGDYVFFGPSCVLTNDINPRGMYSKAGHYIETILEDGVTLGANCTIVCGNRLGKHSLIGSGAVVTKNVEPFSIMVGNPAKRIGEIDEKGNRKIYEKSGSSA
jgi:UDP-2-acetamido-3-amino-2,3-dideoxy-glucuronate N-acetyltransferase